MKRQCKGSVGWGCCAVCMAVGPRSSRSDAPRAWFRQRSAHGSVSRDSRGRLPKAGGWVRMHMRSTVTGTALHSLQCPVTQSLSCSGLNTTCEASGCGGLAR